MRVGPDVQWVPRGGRVRLSWAPNWGGVDITSWLTVGWDWLLKNVEHGEGERAGGQVEILIQVMEMQRAKALSGETTRQSVILPNENK